ncbi:MAG: UDP-4-amino-4,6-dideoxy-N-acetyl-beta-L-altrosamine transaminase [Elusimicrobia bacterium]|nr:UDP-4-amino-4,6-dideoxy-N-acetyl-beta-L-altrosamine transaminase [Elusimicrobiota bacterium]
MIPYGRQTIEDDDVQAVVEALRSDFLTQGPRVEEFEKALARACGSPHAVVFSNGTTALQGAYFAAGLQRGDEVVTSPLTFAATANAALWAGAKVVFADIDPKTGNMDPQKAEALITSRTKILAPVDFAGHPCDWDRLLSLARRRSLIVVEDACHALGAAWTGKPAGSYADLTVFSFHPVKSITTGEGGAVLTKDPRYLERMRRFRHHGITKTSLKNTSPGDWYHEMQHLGINARLTDIQCALGLSQLKKLGRFMGRRRALAERYIRAFQGVQYLSVVPPAPGDESAWHLFVVLLEGPLADKRDLVFRNLREAGVMGQVHYIPVYRHPYYEELGYQKSLCPEAEQFSRRAISLPIYPLLTDAQQEAVIQTFLRLLKEAA